MKTKKRLQEPSADTDAKSRKILKPGTRPVRSIIENLGLGKSAAKYVKPKVNDALNEFNVFKKSDKHTLYIATATYATAIAGKPLAHSWAQYSQHLPKAINAGRRFLHLTGLDNESDTVGSDEIRPVPFGVKLLILGEMPDVAQIEAVQLLIATVQKIAVWAAVNAGKKQKPNSDLRKFLRAILVAALQRKLPERLPQKEQANTKDFDPSNYPLLKMVLILEKIACEAAADTLMRSGLPNANTLAELKPAKSLGAIVAELSTARRAVKKARKKFR